MVGAAAAVLVFQVICTLLPADRAQALIIFGGDGGSLVLGSILMATFYARRESVIVQNELRWGFLLPQIFLKYDSAFEAFRGLVFAIELALGTLHRFRRRARLYVRFQTALTHSLGSL